MNQVLIIDKPAGMTSHDVIDCVRRILGLRSVGHLGTLDPAATRRPPAGRGKLHAPRAVFIWVLRKQYEGTIRLGNATDTYDADGEPTGPEEERRATAARCQNNRQRSGKGSRFPVSWRHRATSRRRFPRRKSKAFPPTNSPVGRRKSS